MAISSSQKLSSIRAWMQSEQLDALLIPSSDDHQSEYVAEHWQVREWSSGFTGSAGTVVITQDFAGLWTDSRYFLQAEAELSDSGLVLMKQGIPHAPEHVDWLIEHLQAGQTIGFDAAQLSASQVFALQAAIEKANKPLELLAHSNPWQSLWPERPE
ncbi:MAG: aminopeptidase P family N-terminal domain-containing protein, partial [Bacteroidota bacterium]